MSAAFYQIEILLLLKYPSVTLLLLVKPTLMTQLTMEVFLLMVFTLLYVMIEIDVVGGIGTCIFISDK